VEESAVNDFWWAAGGALAAFIIEGIIIYLIIPMMASTGAVRSNYRGEEISRQYRISFSMTLLVVYLLYRLFDYPLQSELVSCWGYWPLLPGFLDDMLGRRDTTGFKGHLGRWSKVG
jgi:hypothetical protein